MIKVLVVGQLPPPCMGQAIMIQHLVHSRMSGVEVHHLPMRFSQDVDEVRRFTLLKMLRLIPLVARIIYARIVLRPDVFYFVPVSATRFSMIRDYAILIPTRYLFPKTVFHFHSSGHSELFHRLSLLERWLFRLAYFRADAAIRISELTPADGEGLHARREFIVPNGIEDPAPQQASPSLVEPVTEASPLRVLFVSALYEAKGLLVVIDACGELAKRNVPFRFEVMGKFQCDRFEARVRERVTQLSLNDRIHFLGQLAGNEKLAASTRADVLCHPTFHDTFPLVLLEAMAMSLPVVATGVGGIPSIVEEGRTGFLVRPNDPHATADSLQVLAEDPDLRGQMGAAGRAKFEREYTLKRHADFMRRAFLQTAGMAADEQSAVVSETAAAL